MKEPARDIKNYRTDLSAALEDTFQRRALDKFAVDYRASRERIYSGLNDRELIAEVAARRFLQWLNALLFEQDRLQLLG